MKSGAILLSVIVLGASAASAQEVQHVESAGSVNFEPVSADRALSRLVDAAAEYEQFAPVPRIAFFDLTYPRDLAEYDALDGFALVTVTAVSQLAEELPLARVYFRSGPRSADLPLLAARNVVLDEPEAVVGVLGSHRFDAVFEFPLFLLAVNGELVIDFAANRAGFVLTSFPSAPMPEGFPVAAPTAEHPDSEAVATMIDREIPLLAPHFEP